MSTASRELS